MPLQGLPLPSWAKACIWATPVFAEFQRPASPPTSLHYVSRTGVLPLNADFWVLLPPREAGRTTSIFARLIRNVHVTQDPRQGRSKHSDGHTLENRTGLTTLQYGGVSATRLPLAQPLHSLHLPGKLFSSALPNNSHLPSSKMSPALLSIKYGLKCSLTP